MARLKADARYTVRRLPSKGRPLFEVKKIIDTPSALAKEVTRSKVEATYQVTLVETEGKQPFTMCNCPNSKSGRHIDDKHGRMVVDWMMRGEPNKGYYDNQGEYHL